MKHFSEAECADFTNRMTPPDKLPEMEAHLKKGCAKCEKALLFWKTMKDMLRQETSIAPSEEAIRLAIGTFAIHGPRPRRGLFREIAQLVFDSFREPVLAGVRGGHNQSRRLMFRAGEIMIDLSMEAASRRSHVLLVGQVLDTATSGIGIGSVPVLLMNGRHTVAETRTNPYGEFQMECMENKNLQISVGVTEDKDVFIPLDESIWKTPSDHGVH